MICSKPILLTGAEVPCGQCMSCRINRGRKWTGKLILESASTGPTFNYFVTLTYDEGNLPAGGTLVKEDGRLFRKRLYQALGSQLRFFFVGEYGEVTFRPHYHAILFGVDPTVDITATVAKCWPQGFVTVDHFSDKRAAYVAQYCLKKMTKPDDIRLGSRHPEYSQMSRRPALGDSFVTDVLAPWYQSAQGQAFIARSGDVTSTFRTGGKTYPLTNRHVRMLRAAAGLPELVADCIDRNPAARRPPVSIDKLRSQPNREQQIATRSKIFKSRTQRV
ncbi:MAG: replication initiator protein [Microvirus sp.]|nr:MAG: replication initiator protein [Microvirus sp.]